MEINQTGMKRKGLGTTFIEVLVASAVFAVTLGGMTVGERVARHQAEKSLISFVITHRSQALLEAIQSYKYESPAYGANAVNGFSADQHSEEVKPTYDSSSGVLNKDGSITKLPEESLTLEYHPTTLGDHATSLDPFDRTLTLQNNNSLMGPENTDMTSTAGIDYKQGDYQITYRQRDLNIFTDYNGGLEKYFFMNDVDDFDGYQETQEILPGVFVTFDISVAPIYDNVEDYNHPLLTNEIDQAPYSVMEEEMSVDNFQEQVSGQTVDNARTVAIDYYNKILFKKITVYATWEYPPASGNWHSLVMDGGKMNPNGDAQ